MNAMRIGGCLVVGIAILALLSGCQSSGGTTQSSGNMAVVANGKCPVCGQAVATNTSWHCDYNGQKVGFCCGDCMGKWQAGSGDQRQACWHDCCR